jgi:CubicO group peptidase (beta-lactamase class C family)
MKRTQTAIGAVGDEVAASLPHELKEHDIPGVALGIVHSSGETWLKTFGSTRRGGDRPVNEQTIFSVQSISKTYTATLVMLAVQEELVNLDEPIASYLPRFTVRSRFEDDATSKMTLRHLLSHTAGFTHEAPTGGNYFVGKGTFEDHVLSIQDSWLRFPVGARHEYSNLGVDLAAYVLQERSGLPFAEYARKTLFEPLVLDRTTFDLEKIRRTRNRARGHDPNVPRLPIKIPMVAAGGLYTSVRDACDFVRFHLLQGDDLLDSDLLEEMYRVPFPVTGQSTGYGLGLEIADYRGTRITRHRGAGFGFLADMSWVPDHDVGVVVLTTSPNYPELRQKIVFEAFDRLGALGEPPQPSGPPTFQMPHEQLRRLRGTYIGRGEILQLELRGEELGAHSPDGYKPLRFVSETEALLPDDEFGTHQIRFVFDETNSSHPAHVVSLRDGSIWSYDNGPNDPPGPDHKHWDRYLGKFRIKVHGAHLVTTEVRRRDGYLVLEFSVLGDLRMSERLTEFEPDLFYTSTGETVDFRVSPPTYANIPMLKMRSASS